MTSIARYFLRVLISADQAVNTLLGGLPDETISSPAAKAARKGRAWGCVLCRVLDIFHRDHCERVIELDEV